MTTIAVPPGRPVRRAPRGRQRGPALPGASRSSCATWPGSGAILALGLAPRLWIGVLATGLCSGPMGVVGSVLAQAATPDELRGRVTSFMTMSSYGVVLVAMSGNRPADRGGRPQRRVRHLRRIRRGGRAATAGSRAATGND